MLDSETLIAEVTNTIRTMEPNARILLFGSRARDTAQDDSDWDFLVLLDGEVDEARRDAIRHRLYDLEIAHNTIISSIIVSKEDWTAPRNKVTPLYKRIQEEGVPVAG